ncbi:cysteine-rich secretory protein 3-like [Lemur catta]|uniref:cysteine-rich secretory protein 3-like n=1 Tax=Lemur catta TaxID=9447 RepID=UPI001E26C738|nr:cysteine-rich secretory protein 3-like [Lemur catta]
MTLFLVLLFLVAGLLPCCPADDYQDSKFTAILTSRTEVQKEIVDKHNELRRAVSPSASNMLKMKWSSQSAANAQKWADQCKYQHSTADFRRTNVSCGENLFMSSAITSWSVAIQNWDDEKNDFVFAVGPKTSNAVVGHYTQVVWYSSHLVGCGVAYCPNQNPLKFFFVCQYCPAGNSLARIYTPYQQGKPCASCPKDCDNGLCTNVCNYEDKYSNCKDLKDNLGCGHQLVKDSCKAACNCANKIY